MCGRYASARGAEELSSYFDAVDETVGAGAAAPGEPGPGLLPDWNVAPTKPVPAVLVRAREPDVRRLRVLRWGLVPSWAKDARGGARLINARIETAASKPAFRRAMAARRCILPADGYYEWEAVVEDPPAAGSRPRVRKQPWYYAARDASPLALAGLYEVWSPPDSDAIPLWTVTVLTTDAPDAEGRVHDRTPMLVPRSAVTAWLDPGQRDAGQAAGLLVPGLGGEVFGRPVVPLVNNVANNGPQLLARVPGTEPLDVHHQGAAQEVRR